MVLFPFVDATVDLIVAYARYFAEKRDVRVVVWGLLFVAFCTVPALLIDLVRLPMLIHRRHAR